MKRGKRKKLTAVVALLKTRQFSLAILLLTKNSPVSIWPQMINISAALKSVSTLSLAVSTVCNIAHWNRGNQRLSLGTYCSTRSCGAKWDFGKHQFWTTHFKKEFKWLQLDKFHQNSPSDIQLDTACGLEDFLQALCRRVAGRSLCIRSCVIPQCFSKAIFCHSHGAGLPQAAIVLPVGVAGRRRSALPVAAFPSLLHPSCHSCVERREEKVLTECLLFVLFSHILWWRVVNRLSRLLTGHLMLGWTFEI